MSAEQALEKARTLLGKDEYDIAIALLEAQRAALKEFVESTA